MNFDHTEEQALLRRSLERFVAESYTPAQREAYLAEPAGYRRATWSQLAELGVLALPFAQAEGGLGGGLVDSVLVAEQFGRGLVVDPFLPTVLMAGTLIAQLGTSDQKSVWLPRIMGGDVCLSVAHAERKGRGALSFVATHAAREGGGYRLKGGKTLVLAADPEALIVLARTAGATSDAAGLSCFIVPTERVTLRKHRIADGTLAADAEFDIALPAAARLGPEGEAYEAFEDMIGRASAVLAGEAVGIMDALMEVTLEHLRTRKQFGVPLGSFQALQHRMADCHVALEQARSLVIKAMIADAEGTRTERLRAAFGAKAFAAKAGRLIGEEAVQMHGAIGLTDELSVGRYLKRLLVIHALLGDQRMQLDRYNALAEKAG